MVFSNIRKQQAVGQGFFHTAELHDGESNQLNYIYDCGSTNKYATARTDRISKYLASFKENDRHLEIAFISHAHADHVNGLPQLLNQNTGLKVGTIVLPYFNIAERLISYAYCVNIDPAVGRDEFYKEFVSDPISALSTFKPKQIIFVRSAGNDSPGAPDSDRDIDGPVPDILGPRESKRRATWKFVGNGKIHQHESYNQDEGSSSIKIITIEDSIGIATPVHSSAQVSWLLSPFIDPAIENLQKTFIAALLKALNHGKTQKHRIKKNEFEKWLSDSENLKILLVSNIADLQEAYSCVEKNINFSSMCLYSGPSASSNISFQEHRGYLGKWCTIDHAKIGWLATGDADLKTKKRRLAFLKHYGKIIKNVITITIPHHGSENNYDHDLVTKIDPSICIVAADTFGLWRHPGTKIVQSIASFGRFLSVVTANTTSEATESTILW